MTADAQRSVALRPGAAGRSLGRTRSEKSRWKEREEEKEEEGRAGRLVLLSLALYQHIAVGAGDARRAVVRPSGSDGEDHWQKPTKSTSPVQVQLQAGSTTHR